MSIKAEKVEVRPPSSQFMGLAHSKAKRGSGGIWMAGAEEELQFIAAKPITANCLDMKCRDI
jgi:hypothetical protein